MNAETSKSPQKPDVSWSAINILLGLWLIASPFLLGFRHLHPAILNNVIVGIVLALFALIRVSLAYSHRGWSWCNVLLGVWLVISPFAIRLADNPAVMWNNVIVGLLVGIAAWSSTATPHSRPGVDSKSPWRV